MQVKIFHIRLSKDFINGDQEILNNFLKNVTVIKTESQLISGNQNFWSILIFYEKNKPYNASYTVEDLNEDELHIYEILKKWRRNSANLVRLPNFIICHDSELCAIAKLKPKNLSELADIRGFGKNKVEKYGEEILEILNTI